MPRRIAARISQPPSPDDPGRLGQWLRELSEFSVSTLEATNRAGGWEVVVDPTPIEVGSIRIYGVEFDQLLLIRRPAGATAQRVKLPDLRGNIGFECAIHNRSGSSITVVVTPATPAFTVDGVPTITIDGAATATIPDGETRTYAAVGMAGGGWVTM